MKKIIVLTLIVFCFIAAQDRSTYMYYAGVVLNPCDLNDDNDTNLLDALLMVYHILDDQLLDDDQIIIADLNDDGMLDIIDIVTIVSLIISPPGYPITASNSASVRFPYLSYYLDNTYCIYYLSLKLRDEVGSSSVNVKIHEDEGNSPGEIIYESSIDLTALSDMDYYVYLTTENLSNVPGNYYWLSVNADSPTSEATWLYSSSNYMTVTTSVDNGLSWAESYTGYGGVGRINGEQIYYYEQVEPIEMPVFLLEDVNPNSEYYGQMIGPEVFAGNISCYYFSSVHCGMCVQRFNALNEMYLEFLSEGITDVKMMGNSGTQYDTNDYSYMTDGNVIPWTQSIQETDVWELWDISIRDLVILDREGLLIAHISLNTFNPDPDGIGECTGNYQAIKDVILNARER